MFAAILSAAINTLPASAQSSQAVRVDIPFNFSTNNSTLPAGTYQIEPAGDSRTLWKISGRDHKSAEFLMALTLQGSSQENLRLTFHRYGESNFLVGFKTSDYEVQLPVSGREKALRSTLGPIAAMNVVDVENVTRGSR